MKKKLERLQVLIDTIKSFNNLQEDFIDFTEYEITDNEKDNAVYTLYQLNRRKKEHVILNYEIEEKLEEAGKLLEELVKLSNKKEIV